MKETDPLLLEHMRMAMLLWSFRLDPRRPWKASAEKQMKPSTTLEVIVPAQSTSKWTYYGTVYYPGLLLRIFRSVKPWLRTTSATSCSTSRSPPVTNSCKSSEFGVKLPKCFADCAFAASTSYESHAIVLLNGLKMLYLILVFGRTVCNLRGQAVTQD